MRNNGPANNRSGSAAYGGGGAGGMSSQNTGYNNTGGYRGNRGGGYNNRGGMNNTSGFNRGGFRQPMTGGFQGSGMGGFQGVSMGGMQPYGAFQGRGGMAGGMRGGTMGRGGMNANGMMGMPMGGMGMGAMGAMGMNMPQMGGGMGMQGMPGSYNQTPVSTITQYGSSATPAVHPTSYSPQAGQYPPSIPVGASSSSTGGFMTGTSNNPSSTWAGYTQYSSTPSMSSPSSFPSQASTLGTSVTSYQPSMTLNQEPLTTGNQAHFNPAFFPQGQAAGGGDANWNPHGAKRTRQE